MFYTLFFYYKIYIFTYLYIYYIIVKIIYYLNFNIKYSKHFFIFFVDSVFTFLIIIKTIFPLFFRFVLISVHSDMTNAFRTYFRSVLNL